MNSLPTIEQLQKSQGKNQWDLGNKVLYDLCKNNFDHDKVENILAKFWLIGRAYAAAIERRKNKTEINDVFYINKVAPIIKESQLDAYLDKLKGNSETTSDNLPLILQTHNYLTTTLKKITGLEKRSLSSKYLHFHLPNLFFIYDSRAEGALKHFVSEVPSELQNLTYSGNVDGVYSKFVCKCYGLKTQIELVYNVSITPRQLDNILIEIANSALEK